MKVVRSVGRVSYPPADRHGDILVVRARLAGYNDGMNRDGRGFGHQTLDAIGLIAVVHVRSGAVIRGLHRSVSIAPNLQSAITLTGKG